MIRLTRLDGDVFFVNPDLIEAIEETPDTHIVLSNGRRYLVIEKTDAIVARIISFKSSVMKRALGGHGRKYLRRKMEGSYLPRCPLKPGHNTD
ncbi:flagellar FlbD family protein [Geobacter sulfurreducens]|jgi:flagellar protein FlbD|uniref:Flagellar protein FlbD n=1 Tax=Geobacter sulfurreducens (strain ATCC 51573 / DSM 12127 / PCA) TaxID=243231 RepID=Q748H6_GEOSL|nr:flagellar FlbD family protein [Geobacter sulfurreducens]AAR36418.1 flagellar protein FlbD [Geobacter sulfurreducens PCA]ADI85778.1 flagellar protein FlbD [Geobacter sulfurreducens KN400]QVW34826.1 flagellar FlbD family protein [Geobacter sulfurreducens]UAC03696.1 flagellar FlbD family protein [Geobacter sulfurreducens]UTG92345.1 flagellar FlbD family protein [Geobacter sulfurreducens]